jgi:hypothetical protein
LLEWFGSSVLKVSYLNENAFALLCADSAERNGTATFGNNDADTLVLLAETLSLLKAGARVVDFDSIRPKSDEDAMELASALNLRYVVGDLAKSARTDELERSAVIAWKHNSFEAFGDILRSLNNDGCIVDSNAHPRFRLSPIRPSATGNFWYVLNYEYARSLHLLRVWGFRKGHAVMSQAEWCADGEFVFDTTNKNGYIPTFANMRFVDPEFLSFFEEAA